MRRKNRRQSEDGNLDLTPMMDIVFIMLIFFIVTTSFVKETGVDINRPNAETAERDEKGNILVALTATNEIWIDKRRVDLKAVRANIERLKIEYPEGSVIIQADKESRSGLLVETMDQIRTFYKYRSTFLVWVFYSRNCSLGHEGRKKSHQFHRQIA